MSRVSDGFDCGACDRPNSVHDMVQCDACSVWYHMDCAGVTPSVSSRKWFCKRCTVSRSSAQAVETARKSGKQVAAKPKKGKVVASGTVSAIPDEFSGDAAKKVPLVGVSSADCGTARVKVAKTGKSASGLPSGDAALAGCGDRKVLVSGNDAKGLPLGGASSADFGTPKKHVPLQKRANTIGGSARSSTSSSRALAQLALKRLEEKRNIEEQKLEIQQRELEKERERLRKERELEEHENAIARKKLEMWEKFLEEKQDLELQLAEDDVLSQSTFSSGRSKTREWLKNQHSRDGASLASSVGGLTIENPAEKGLSESNVQVSVRNSCENCRCNSGNHEATVETPSANQIAARKLWPRKLPTFSGDPEEWPIFYSSYLDSNAACGFSPVEKVVRLRECLRGPARDAVVTKFMFPNAAPSIMETLRRLYGRPELLVKNLLAKVRHLEVPKPERLDTLINFGMAVQQLRDHLEAADLLEELVQKLPAANKLEWVRYKRAFTEPSLKEFGEFMEQLVEDANPPSSES